MIKRKLTRFTLIALAIAVAISGYVFPSPASAKSTQQKMENAYYGVLNNIISKYGVSTNDEEDGLVYTNLIDFDKDGRSELYVLYLKEAEWNSELRFYQEVWRFSNSKLRKIYADNQGHDGLAGDRSISISNTKSASYLDFTHRYSTGTGDPPYSNIWFESTDINTIKNGKLVRIALLSYIEASTDSGDKTKKTYSIEKGGKTQNITLKEYNRLKSQFGLNNQKEIISSSAGFPGTAFDTSRNENTINTFMTKIKKLMK
ncbi:hypothetical protein ABGV40_14080 [Paenibacillus amylolyticus]|uniref:hypothetical protein n=1 Tax=Paenibacillus amylolyticus TaxID=1451 RepID=UPI00324276A1